jgi:hypothetical protein
MPKAKDYRVHLDFAAYEQLEPQLLDEGYRGKWALISWGRLVDTFRTSEEAFARGLQDGCFVVVEVGAGTPSIASQREALHRYLNGLKREVSEWASGDAFARWLGVAQEMVSEERAARGDVVDRPVTLRDLKWASKRARRAKSSDPSPDPNS